MRRRGVEDVRTADFLPGRPNVWGERRGAGGGPRLLFIGHTDTVHVDGWRQHWQGTEREDPFAAPVVDGAVWGRGAGDLKAGIAASLAALGVLDRAGVRLAGDIGFAFVGDEESGQPGTGVSAGVRAYVARIAAGEVARPDFIVYVEPTRLAVYAAQMGFFIAEITVVGRSAYFGVPELGRDALKAAHAVLAALWAHSDAVAARAEHPLVGRGFLLVTGIEGGGFIAVPERCTLSLIRKLLPGESLDAAAQELEAAVRGAVADPEIRVEIAYPAGRDHRDRRHADRDRPALGPVRLLAAATAEAMPGRGGIEGAPFWSEAPFFTRSACRRSIARPATSATATPSRSTSSSTSISRASSPTPASSRASAGQPNSHDNREKDHATEPHWMRARRAGAGRAGLDADRRAGRRERHALVGDHPLGRRPRRAEGQGPQGGAALAHLVRLHERGHRRRHRRVRPRRHPGGGDDRRRLRRRQAALRHRDGARRQAPTSCWRCRSTR